MPHSQLTISDLARTVEQIHFARSHHISTDNVEFEDLKRVLLQRAPFHPLALNLRAFDALPETALPAPSKRFSGIARAFMDGRYTDALSEAQGVVSQDMTDDEQARLYTTIGDLESLLGSIESAEDCFRKALLILGPLPPLHARLGRCAFLRGDADTARSRAIRALVENPIYGTAMVLYLEACRSRSIQLLPIPVQAGLVRTQSGWVATPDLSPKAVRAWEAWLNARASCTLEEFPPERTPTLALIQAWRSGTNDDLSYTDTPNPELDALERMERDGILDGYLWFAGLDSSNANQWRAWKQEHPRTMERFWSEGLILP
ncbi:MAG: hypothetical protein VX519_04005 [Myxococcota bacterium]|nr:hypothetical protein [Myxococcota bacterium]